jgi:CRP-like cAMP-binding protein
MTIDLSKRVEFLAENQLFAGLNPLQLEAVANELVENACPKGKEIATQGSLQDSLYLIHSGGVTLTRIRKGKAPVVYEANGSFGEDSMRTGRHRWAANATTNADSVLLGLKREQFERLAKITPVLRANFAVVVNTHRLERHSHFKWLQAGEIICFMTRKNIFLLLQGMIGPALLGLGAIIGMVAAWYYSLWVPALSFAWYISLAAGIMATLWGIWKGVDWTNDYYIITDRRIVWLEKIIGLYESRQETPLSAIQRVNVETDLSGRMLDYGTLLISTIVGNTLKLEYMDHPNQAAGLIDLYWKRSKETARRMDKVEVNNALRARLLEGRDEANQTQGVIAKNAEPADPYEQQRGLANLFRLRFEGLSTVTYRKHLFVLFTQTLIPGLILFLLAGVLVYELISPTSLATMLNMKLGVLVAIWLFLGAGALLWWIYEYVDWRNDIFQVTPEQIMDIDKTPLGQATSDVAALSNILSIEYKRVGILEVLFNYGTVYITIGGGKEMAFENVFNPSAVQADIERRRLERIDKQKQETIDAERERTADWFEAFFDSEQQLRQEKDAKPGRIPGDNNPKNEVK